MMPTSLTITDTAIALDGGSIFLDTRSETGARFVFYLDWSLTAQYEGTTSFSVNEQVIPKGSAEESTWLSLLNDAAIAPDPGDEPEGAWLAPPSRRMVRLTPSENAFIEAIDDGPEAALRVLISLLGDRLSSETYRRTGRPIAPPPPSPEEVIRSLLSGGRRMEAMLTYRKTYPGASPQTAKEAVQAMKKEVNIAREQND